MEGQTTLLYMYPKNNYCTKNKVPHKIGGTAPQFEIQLLESHTSLKKNLLNEMNTSLSQ